MDPDMAGMIGPHLIFCLCLDRLLPPRKDRPITLEIPVVSMIDDGPASMTAIASAVANGETTVPKRAQFAKLVEKYVRDWTINLENRLRAMKESQK